MRLMIVDDNQLMRKTIIQVVAQNNDEILECSCGAEAVKKYSDFDPDWVLMDIQMKEINGFTATEEILHQDPNANIAIVTNHDIDAYRKTAEKLGVKYYFLKENLFGISEILK